MTKPSTPAKPATKTPPAVAKKPTSAPTEAPDDDIDDDDIDGDPEDGASSGPSWKATMKLPHAQRVQVRLRNVLVRIEKQHTPMKKWPGEPPAAAVLALDTAVASINTAIKELAKLPADWRPAIARAAGSGGADKAELKTGDLVRITDKRKEEYEGVLEPEMMVGIKVLEVRGPKVIGEATAKDGTTLRCMLSRGHVCLDQQAA